MLLDVGRDRHEADCFILVVLAHRADDRLSVASIIARLPPGLVLRGDEICDEELTELLGVHIGLTIEYLGEVIVVLFSRHSDFKVLDDVAGRGVEEIAVLINALNELT